MSLDTPPPLVPSPSKGSVHPTKPPIDRPYRQQLRGPSSDRGESIPIRLTHPYPRLHYLSSYQWSSTCQIDSLLPGISRYTSLHAALDIPRDSGSRAARLCVSIHPSTPFLYTATPIASYPAPMTRNTRCCRNRLTQLAQIAFD